MAAALKMDTGGVGGLFRRVESALMQGTSAGAPARSPLEFGVSTAQQFSAERRVAPRSELQKNIDFTIAEARDRIREFLDGSYSPKRLGDLISYFADRMLRFESRRAGDGHVANYLVDTRTNSSVPAAAVDARLSRPGLTRMFGNTLEAEAEAVRRRAQRTPEQMLAQTLRNDNAGRLLIADGNASPFEDWDDMTFAAPAMFRGRDVAVQGKEIFLGVAYGRASANPSENLALVQKARAEGKRLIIPAMSKEDAAAGRFTPGMPILLREGAVRSRMVDPRLNYERLSSLFGKSLHEHYAGLEHRYGGTSQPVERPKVVDIADFRAQFRRRAAGPAVPAEPIAPAASAFAGPTIVIRHEIDPDGNEALAIVDNRTGQAAPFSADRLSPGDYPKEDGFGMPSGKLSVNGDGSFAHKDAQGRFHNTLGPALIPAAGSNGRPRYALEGQVMDKAVFDAQQHRALFIPAEPAGQDGPALNHR